jgi:DNA helicase-2/ATP-dependent DNA helicase PcrA
VGYLLRSIERYEALEGGRKPSIAEFLQRITMRLDKEEAEAGNRVTLSTLHASKGLEFPIVFLIGCVEGQLPHSRSTDPKITEASPSDVEEERRLFYVGVTRAREQLYLSRPKQRMMRGKVTELTPSRFLDGLPEQYVTEYIRTETKELDFDEIAELGRKFLERARAG